MNRPSESSRTSDFPTDSPSMALSVTRHAQIAGPNEWQRLSAGLDSLDVGCFVHWDANFPRLIATLNELKQVAAGTEGVHCPLAGCVVLPSAKPPNYRWHLEFPEFHLFIGKSSRPRNQTPNAYVSLNSVTLWNNGLYGSLEIVAEKISLLGGIVIGQKISRVDLASDYLLSESLTSDFLKSRLVSRASRTQIVENRDKLETFYVGAKNSPVQLRIYDKGLEVKREGTKMWFLKVWGRESCDGVWRVEFQIRRLALKTYRIDTPDDLMDKVGALWKYLTEQWLSFRCRDDSTTTRRTVEPFWRGVQSAASAFGSPEAPFERHLSSIPADVKTCVSQIAGRAMTYAARTNCRSLQETVDRLRVELLDLVGPEQFDKLLQIKRIQMGRFPNTPTTNKQEESNGLS